MAKKFALVRKGEPSWAQIGERAQGVALFRLRILRRAFWTLLLLPLHAMLWVLKFVCDVIW